MTDGPGPIPAEGESKCGFIALSGAPNAGKSTLLNRIVGTKIAIVTPKVQTTRARMSGIALRGPAQLIFIDTPGIFTAKRRLERAMVAAAWSGITDADVAVVVVDGDRAAKSPAKMDPDTADIVAGLKRLGARAVLALNKIDLVRAESLLEVTRVHDASGVFERIFMISATTGDGVDDLVDHLVQGLRPGPWLYPEDQLTDVPMRVMAAEITREQAFLQLHQELPYALTVETESWQEREDGAVRIDQIILIQRESQKGMVVGKGGSRIKSIGTAARVELEQLLGRKVHLFLHVKARPNWMERPEHYREMGLDFKG
ncbi:MAG: GTPase Era [Alphaproteobacteria bacterium]|nr:MAG: GTPase Era [Alphaproteobacteria bacterium]